MSCPDERLIQANRKDTRIDKFKLWHSSRLLFFSRAQTSPSSLDRSCSPTGPRSRRIVHLPIGRFSLGLWHRSNCARSPRLLFSRVKAFGSTFRSERKWVSRTVLSDMEFDLNKAPLPKTSSLALLLQIRSLHSICPYGKDTDCRAALRQVTLAFGVSALLCAAAAAAAAAGAKFVSVLSLSTEWCRTHRSSRHDPASRLALWR